jgi:Kef-type K+ transport system membrane component KefB
MTFSDFNIQLPVTDPTWIFFLVLSIILFAPMLFERFRIPPIIGLILAGVIVGKHGFNVLNYDSSFRLFCNVGLYYIMFLAGLEMNMGGFKENRVKALTHGILAFIIPMLIGFVTNMSILQYGAITSVLLASMYASHTLIAYPIVIRYGVSQHRSVGIAVGATAITDTLTLLVLAVIGGMFKGESSGFLVIFLIVKVVFLSFLIIFFLPRIARWFFRHYDDNVAQFLFVLAMVFLGGGMMKMMGMEGILGAFLAGLVLNRLIPKVSPLMNHLEFVGNALFIPYFLIGVGMLMNVKIFFNDSTALKVAGVMTVVALISKWLASFATQKIFNLRNIERELIFGLSSAQAAATLAAVLVGYNIILPNHQRLLNDDILNATILLIFITCIFSSFTTESAARKLALSDVKIDEDRHSEDGPCLISYSNPDTVDSLTQIAMMIHDNTNKSLLGLNVLIDSRDNNLYARRNSQFCLARAIETAAAANVKLVPLKRVSTNIITGIIHTMKENDATELVIGLHRMKNIADSFFGGVAGNLLKGTYRQIIIVRCLMPPNTLRRIIVAVPPKAEYEVGFYKWVEHLCRMGIELGCRVHFYAHTDTMIYIKNYIGAKHNDLRAEYSILDDWGDLLILTQEVNFDHLLVIVSARRGFISYQSQFEHLPQQISRYFSNNSLMILYPDQYGDPLETPPSLFTPKPLREMKVSFYNRVKKWIVSRLRKK